MSPIYICTFVYMYIHTYTCTHMYVYVYIYMYKQNYRCTHVYNYIYIYSYICTLKIMHTYTCMHTCVMYFDVHVLAGIMSQIVSAFLCYGVHVSEDAALGCGFGGT